MSETEIYKPSLVSEEPLEISAQEISYNKNLSDGTENGFIPMDVDKDVAMQRMSRDLYQFASSGFRELYTNEARACRYAKEHHNASPTITVTLNPETRKLVLEGTDSTGMTSERFKKVFTVLGHSDNFDGKETGQFGMGRAAYTCLSDTVIIETYARDSGEKYAVMGRNGLGYQIINEPEMDSYGTRISLTMYKDIDYTKLYQMICNVSRFSGIQTILVLESKIQDGYNAIRQGQYVLGPVSHSERIEQVMHGVCGIRDDDQMIPVSVESDLIRIDGCLFIDKSEWKGPSIINPWKSKYETYLVNVPIDAQLDIPLSFAIVSIKDERKIMPTPDRERLAENSIRAVQNEIDRLLEQNTQFDIGTLQELYDSEHNKLYRLLAEGITREFEQKIIRCLSEPTQDLVNLLSLKVHGTDKKKHLLQEVLQRQSEIFHIKKLERAKIAALEKIHPGCLIFKPEHLDEMTSDMLGKFGILSAESYIEENSIRAPRIAEKAYDCAVHSSAISDDGYSSTVALHSARTNFSSIPEKTIRANAEFQTVRGIFKNIVCSYSLVKDRKSISDKGISFSEFVSDVQSKTYPTNKGDMSVQGIAKNAEIHLLEYDNKNLAQTLGEFADKLLVISDADELFEVATWLSWKDTKYVFVKNESKYGGLGFSVEKMINRYATKRNVEIDTADYVDLYYNHVDDIPKLMSVLDGIMSIKDDRVLAMFLDAAKKHARYDNRCAQNELPLIQEHLKAARQISEKLK